VSAAVPDRNCCGAFKDYFQGKPRQKAKNKFLSQTQETQYEIIKKCDTNLIKKTTEKL